ncbi:MAG: trigger factor [Candidatus Latescibacteria bacterium]|nr:trigger factor [Candidatus Latescibacterota bacterium]
MAKVEIKERDGCTTKLQVEIERERFDSEFTNSLKSVRKEVQISGFRKGKVPESLIARRFGSIVREEAIKELIPKVLQEVFESEKLHPIGEPQLTDLKFDQTGPMTLMVSIEEVPEIDISGFENLHVTKEIIEVSDEDVENTLDRYRNMRAVQQEVDRESKEDDILIVNLQKLDSVGVPIIGDKLENRSLYLNKKSVPSHEYIDQLTGLKKGDRKTVRFPVGDHTHNQDAPREIEMYEVEVLQIIENVIPELNDEFASSLGDYASLDELRGKTREHLTEQIEMSANQKLRSDLIEEFVRQSPFEVPDSLVQKVMNNELDSMKKNRPDQPVDDEDFKRRMRPDAVRAVQTYLIIDEIKEKENIDVTKEEIADRIEIIAKTYNMDPKEFRRKLIKDGRLDNIKNDIIHAKVYEWINGKANITTRTIEKKDEQPSGIITP